jgi:hypothetical protein
LLIWWWLWELERSRLELLAGKRLFDFRGERTAKYNQLLRIEERLGDRAVYAGKWFRDPTKIGE